MIYVGLQDVDNVITNIQLVFEKAGLHLNLDKTKILIYPQGSLSEQVSQLTARYKWLNISEWIGHPLSFSKDLQLISVRKHLMDFSYAMHSKEGFKTEVKIPAINNECIRIFVPL